MKKVLTIAILTVMILMVAMTVVKAATSNTLADELYAIGKEYGMKQADKVKMEKYLAQYPLSDADCNKILELAKQAEAIMIENGTNDYKALPTSVKNQLKDLANQAAEIAGVTLDFKADGIDVYKDGKLVESITGDNTGKLSYTGSNVSVVIASVAVIALAATGITVATKKRLAANA